MVTAMKKLLYIDLEFHIKTASSRFLYELLEEFFWVDKCFLKLDGKIEELPEEYTSCYYDYLVLFQVMPERKYIERFSYGKGILFPMYDNSVYNTIDDWNEYKDFTIINFSRTLYHYLSKKGFESKYIQYFPKPQKIDDFGDAKALFFWQRTNQIYANQVLSLCKNLNLKKVHIHKALDPAYHYMAVNSRFQYDFTFSSWLSNKADLLRLISEAAYYVAPRRYEGIGMSFLDAMAMGRCVIAPNYPTMNEYIDDGINGILYDYDNPHDLIIKDVRQVQERAYLSTKIGYEKWLHKKDNIIEWIEEDGERLKPIYIKYQANEIPSDKTKQKDKYYSYYILMNKWLLLKNKNITLESWFQSEGVCCIALYGYSEMAARLAEELEKTSVHIDCYIDRESRWTEDGRRTIKLSQFIPEVDMVVITSFYYFNEIRELFKDKVAVPIISLEEIVNDLLRGL